ncbi:54S ribosomal protein L6 mitochondrial [Leucoagaricus gongylophorus]
MLPRPLLGSLTRLFSTSASLSKHVSHIGANPVEYPPSVTLTHTMTHLTITGPLGTTYVSLRSYMKISHPKLNTIALTVENAEIKDQRQMWGTTRTLIANAIQGMTKGFTIPLYLVGVGFRATVETDPRPTTTDVQSQRINMKVGHSHNIIVPIPPYIRAETPIPTKIVLSCTDKHLLGLFAAEIRRHRKPEPYKGKGIFVGDEMIRIKSVKKK